MVNSGEAERGAGERRAARPREECGRGERRGRERSGGGEQRRGRERSGGEESSEAESGVGAVNSGEGERGAGERRAAKPREE